MNLTKASLKTIAAAVDEKLWVTIRSLLRHEPAEGANAAYLISLEKMIAMNHLDIRVTRKPGDGGWVRSSVASIKGEVC